MTNSDSNLPKLTNRPRNLIVGGANIQTGPELHKDRGRKTFGEYIGIL
jgi:hypothetical protein